MSAKIFQDLVAFEKDYKYNVTLLKIKEEEIESQQNFYANIKLITRYKLSNAKLQMNLNQSFDEIKELKSKVWRLEDFLHTCEQDREADRRACEDILGKLTEKLNNVKRKHEIELEERNDDAKRRCKELEVLQKKELNDRDAMHHRKVAEIEEKLRNATDAISKLGNKIENLIEDNMALRNKKREMEARLIPQITLFKNELQSVKSTNMNLSAEIEFLQKEYQEYNVNFNRIKSENQYLRKHLEESDRQVKDIVEENEKLLNNNNILTAQIQECFKINSRLVNRCGDLETDKQRLEGEINKLIEAKRNIGHIPEHRAHEDLLKQNIILREIVKSMKMQRETLLVENRKSVQASEERVDHLEQLINELKRLMPNVLP